MPSEKGDDPLDDVQAGETVEVTAEDRIWAHDIAYPVLSGHDREVESIRLTGASIETDERGDEEVVVQLAADVTKIDPKTKPVFQTEELYESRSGSSSTSSSWPWYAKFAVQAVPTVGLVAFSTWLSTRIIDAADITINGSPVSSPGWLGLFFVSLIILVVVMAPAYLPGRVGGVSS